MEEVLECRKSYNCLLKKTLEDQKNHTSLLISTCSEQNFTIHGSCWCREYDDNFDYENNGGKDLIQWLRDVKIDEQSIKKVSFIEDIKRIIIFLYFL